MGQANTHICSKCGYVGLSSDKFCRKCGNPLNLENRCEKCGNIVQPKDFFCTKCGSSLTHKTATIEKTQTSKEKRIGTSYIESGTGQKHGSAASGIQTNHNNLSNAGNVTSSGDAIPSRKDKMKERIKLKADNTKTAKKELTQTKKRTPVYYGASGCALGFIIMVIFVAAAMLAGPLLPISGQTFGTILNVGSWVLPIGLGVLGYFYGKSKQ